MDCELGHGALMGLNGLDGLSEPDVPQADLSLKAVRVENQPQRSISIDLDSLSGDELPIPTSLHVRVDDPRFVMPLVASDHVVSRWQSTIVDFDSSVSETSDEDVTGDLIAGQRRQARVGPRREVL